MVVTALECLEFTSLLPKPQKSERASLTSQNAPRSASSVQNLPNTVTALVLHGFVALKQDRTVVMELLQNKGSGWTGKVIEDEITKLVDIHDFECISDKSTALA